MLQPALKRVLGGPILGILSLSFRKCCFSLAKNAFHLSYVTNTTHVFWMRNDGSTSTDKRVFASNCLWLPWWNQSVFAHNLRRELATFHDGYNGNITPCFYLYYRAFYNVGQYDSNGIYPNGVVVHWYRSSRWCVATLLLYDQSWR